LMFFAVAAFSATAAASSQDSAVRKNAAIVLAKAMRCDKAKERVRELRGIEMLVALGPKL